MKTLRVKTNRRTELVDITREVEQAVSESGVKSGVCHVYVPHTTAGVIINEHADPDVASDVEGIFDRLIPHKGPYRHAEGNTDAHMKAILTGTSQMVLIEKRQTRSRHLAGNLPLRIRRPAPAHRLRKNRA